MTLDADVVKALQDRMRERGSGFKETINAALRRGLRADAPSTVCYSIPVFDSEIRPGLTRATGSCGPFVSPRSTEFRSPR